MRETLTGLLIFIYDTASDIQESSWGFRVNTSISLKPFIKEGITLQWLPYFLLYLRGSEEEIKHGRKPGSVRDKIYSLLLHCRCLRAVKLKVMALPVINLWLSCSMFHEGYNGLGIVLIVKVTAKMTNEPLVTNQQRHLQCHSDD